MQDKSITTPDLNGTTEYPLSILGTDLTPGAKITYITLLMYAQSTGKYPGHYAIGRTLGLTSRSVFQYMGILESRGLIRGSRVGFNQTNSYTVYLPTDLSVAIGHLKSGKGAGEVRTKVKISRELQWEVWLRDNFTCRRCNARSNLSVDHIHPESKGGTLDLENLQTLCKRCNSKKGNRPVVVR